MKKVKHVFYVVVLCCAVQACSLRGDQQIDSSIVVGADRTEEYVPYLLGKKVGLTINNTSTIGGKLSMDSLVALGVDVVRGFGPEHGFRGNASAGAKI